jgi:hypothetical protein
MLWHIVEMLCIEMFSVKVIVKSRGKPKKELCWDEPKPPVSE